MKFTFGRSAAACRLEKLVESNPSARRQVSALLSLYSNQLLQIVLVKDPQTVRLCMELLRDYTLRRIDIKAKLNTEMKTYLKNVVIARYRAYRKGFDDVNRVIERRKKQ